MSSVPARADHSHLAGHRFPGGSTVVPEWMNHLWCDAVGSADRGGHVHPVLVYYAAVEGSGVDFQDIFDLMDASSESGIMLGQQRIDFAGPVAVGERYLVDGGIRDVIRKEGRRAGVFELLTFELCLRTQAAVDPTATVVTTFVFPRADAS